MAPQPSRRLVDPDDVRADGFAVPAPRDHEMLVVGLRSSSSRHHQVPAVRFDHRLEPFHRGQQVRQLVGALGAGQGDSALAQPGHDLRRGARPFLIEAMLRSPWL